MKIVIVGAGRGLGHVLAQMLAEKVILLSQGLEDWMTLSLKERI